MTNVKLIYEFIDHAIKSRKYPENTGSSLKTALKLFEVELNDDERNSIDLFINNIEQIYQNVFAKNKNFSASSLAVYKSRVLKAINDYKKYGIDPTKMANWTPKVVTRSRKISPTNDVAKSYENRNDFSAENNTVHSFEFSGVRLLIPKTTMTTEAIMDGELKQIKTELKAFAEKYCEKDHLLEINSKE